MRRARPARRYKKMARFFFRFFCVFACIFLRNALFRVPRLRKEVLCVMVGLRGICGLACRCFWFRRWFCACLAWRKKNSLVGLGVAFSRCAHINFSERYRRGHFPRTVSRRIFGGVFMSRWENFTQGEQICIEIGLQEWYDYLQGLIEKFPKCPDRESWEQKRKMCTRLQNDIISHWAEKRRSA